MNQQQRLVLLALLAPSLLAAQTPLWDMDGHPDTRAIYAVAFNNDGSKVISGSECDDARVRLWNSTDGTMLWDGQISSSLFASQVCNSAPAAATSVPWKSWAPCSFTTTAAQRQCSFTPYPWV
ncbi:MAG: hypothetical protein IPJ85_10450 [Flavobacteriales bacterium]|nr:hypothetical protein [Flavobacteriales bacterium]